ncbi:LytTR family transcriptional regulator [Aestuariibacter halophilus]|uniref:LytTR family transcriptional regulator n=1 Tax=Fluctibacter halophilus TaxID=226011 RepID=A0ABS8G6M9_9ALTE|nr:LytTR family DNA-binding domain-containing protein [Aestuariibacter halophilus]MCC2616247.1 LytTR family transcriptional regulator [Aestuariibacter halophilus]
MPVRIMAVYGMLYLLIPRFLLARRYPAFLLGYLLLIGFAGCLQMFISVFFYQNLMVAPAEHFSVSFAGWFRSCLLINTTVLLIGAIRMFQLYISVVERHSEPAQEPEALSGSVTVKANKRFYRIPCNEILFVEGMGNYVKYHLKNGEHKTVYASLKETLDKLPDTFLRLHRSYVINKQHVDSFSAESVFIQGATLPRGKGLADSELTV